MPDPDLTYTADVARHAVEWPMLAFFIGLSVMVCGLVNTGAAVAGVQGASAVAPALVNDVREAAAATP